MKFRWCRINGQWTIAEFRDDLFFVPGCPSETKDNKNVNTNKGWGKSFKWGDWIKKPIKYKDIICKNCGIELEINKDGLCTDCSEEDL